MMIFNYKTKKELKSCIGKKLDYTETSMFGPEYNSNGIFCGSNRPWADDYPKLNQRQGREFFAEVKIVNNIIKRVN